MYSGNKVFYNAEVTINKGDFIFLTASSGQGKTTFLKLLSALQAPDKGDIIVNNLNIINLNDNQISDYRKSIGIISQKNYFIEDETVKYNISIPLLLSNIKNKEDKVDIILDLVNLNGFGNKIISSLSCSERQRVAIARGIIHSPDIILADEPTENQDEIQSEILIKMLIKLSQYGTTVILATRHHGLAKEFKQKILSIENEKIISL
tara:strand:- start:76 stop:696 length:621 start_codon:yes stop_codon:yes gene_type:complete